MKRIFLKPEYTIDDVIKRIAPLNPIVKEVSVVYHISYIEEYKSEPETRAFTIDKNNRRVVFSLYAKKAKELLEDMLCIVQN